MKRLLFLAVIFAVVCRNSAQCAPLEVVMDYYPPFSHEEKGQIRGVATEVVKAVFKEAGLEADIKQYPFVRAFKMTQENESVFEYCVLKTPEREKKFQWIGVVSPARHSIFALKDRDIRVENVEDLSRYVIGTVREDASDQYLRMHEKRLGLKLDRVSDYELNMKKLFEKRFDLCAMNEHVGKHLVQKIGYFVNDIKTVYRIEELTGEYYLVTGLKTPVEMVNRLRAAFETVHNGGIYQNIVDDYFQK